MKSFEERFLPVTADCIFTEDGYYVWCGSLFRHGDSYYLAYSRWKREYGFEAWVTHSEICLAKSDSPLGKMHHVRTILTANDTGRWDSSCAHNPTVLAHNGKYYLAYMGNDGPGEYWANRNRQRVGIAWCEDPEGEWHFADKPAIDVTPDGIDDLMTSNPSITIDGQGRAVMIYKAVQSCGILPRGKYVVCAIAFADDPAGEWTKVGKQIMVNPETGWSVEDPFIWYDGEVLRVIVKDFHGYFTGVGHSSAAMFESADGIDWTLSDPAMAFGLRYLTESGWKDVKRLERPQLYFENGHPTVLTCACMEQNGKDVYSVRIPLKATE